MPDSRERVYYGWYVVGGASLALFLSYGIIYAFGSFFTPLSQAFDANRAAISGLFAISVAVPNLLGVVTGPLADRLGPRPLVLVGGILIGAGILAVSRADALWQIYAAYGLGVGVGTACVLVPVTEAVQHWFVRRRAFASGLAVAGIGAGNLILPPVAAALLRVMDWRDVFVVLGIVAAVGIVAASRLVDASPERRGLRPDGDPPDPSAGPPKPPPGMTLREALAQHHFRLLYAAILIGGFGVFVPFSQLVPDAEAHGIHPVVAAILLGLIGGGSLAGRFLTGSLADRFGRRRSLAATFAAMAIFLAGWLVADQAWSLAIFAVGFGLTYGSWAALTPALAVDYFGARHAGAIIGVLYTSIAPGAFLGSTMAGYAYDRLDSYTVPIIACAATVAVATVCTVLLPDPQPIAITAPTRAAGTVAP
ncbi:MAG: MFS transporter [Dehalococcoidia bacterium]